MNNPNSRIEGLEIGGETYNLFSYRDEENPTELGKMIIGGAGNNRHIGGAGNDFLYGGDGNDSLIGGAGNDRLIGGAGNDYLDGGIGNDVYIVRKGEGSDGIYDTRGN